MRLREDRWTDRLGELDRRRSEDCMTKSAPERGSMRPVKSLIVIDAYMRERRIDCEGPMASSIVSTNKRVGGNTGTWIWIITHANDSNRSGCSKYCRK